MVVVVVVFVVVIIYIEKLDNDDRRFEAEKIFARVLIYDFPFDGRSEIARIER